jgi:YfiR/HmsC-like
MTKDAIQRSARSKNATAAVLGFLAMSLFTTLASAAEYSEDAVKAAYLYRFAGYIDWPERGPATPFTIDVLGAPRVAGELRRLLPGHLIHGQVAQVREISEHRDLGNAQIVYVAAGHADLVRSLLPQTSGNSMLVVTDEEDGLSSGSTLNFLTVDRNVRFEVSLTAAQRWGLKISSELLGVAIRVQGRAGQSFLGCGPLNQIDAILGPCGPRMAHQAKRVALQNPVPAG